MAGRLGVVWLLHNAQSASHTYTSGTKGSLAGGRYIPLGHGLHISYLEGMSRELLTHISQVQKDENCDLLNHVLDTEGGTLNSKLMW